MDRRVSWVFAVLVSIGVVEGYYIPGVAQSTFEEGFPLDVFADKMVSNFNKLPQDYFSLPFCQKGKPSLRQQHLSFGEILMGNRRELTGYEFITNAEETCKVYCAERISALDVKKFKKKIDDNYYVRLNVDNMPAIFQYSVNGTSYKFQGFPLGYIDNGRYYLLNHVHFTVMLHRPTSAYTDLAPIDQYRVVGFKAEPKSVKYDTELAEENNDVMLKDCGLDDVKPEVELDLESPDGQYVVFSYDVSWEQSDVKWATRFDTLLNADPRYKSIQWFYIINSLGIMVFLSLLVAGIMLRTVYLDFARYNNLAEVEDHEEETGWKQIHGDVFRPPPNYGLLSVFCGTGAQIAAIASVTLLFSHLGFFSMAYRGGLLSGMILFWVITSAICGYVSARMYITFGGTKKKVVTLGSAFLFSGAAFAVFFLTNTVLWLAKSTAAVNFFTLLKLLALWVMGSLPLNVLGAFFGYKSKPVEFPSKVATEPRPLTGSEGNPAILYAVVSGIIPFGVVFIELVFILNSFWQDDIFYMFGFLFVVFCIFVVTCGEVSIVLTYLTLCKEDWRWWWIAFISSASSGLYVLQYSFYFIITHSGLHGIHYSSIFLYGSYAILLSLCLSVFAGTVGLFSSLVFVRKLYGGLHME